MTEDRRKLEIIQDTINGYLAFDSAHAHQLIAEGKTPVFVIDSIDAFKDFDSIEGEGAKKVALFFDRAAGDHHNEIVLEVQGDTHCVQTCDLSGISIIGDGKEKSLRGDFSNGAHALSAGDPIAVQYKKFYIKGGAHRLPQVVSFNALIANEHIQIVPNKSEISLVDFDREAEGAVNLQCNADAPCDIEVLDENGIDDIGLYRTENMMKGIRTKDSLSPNPEGYQLLKDLYLEQDDQERDKYLKTFRQMQYEHFVELFKALNQRGHGTAINIRLLDENPSQIFNGKDLEKIKDLYGGIKRGVELAEAIPGLYEAQISAIMEAARDAGLSKDVSLGFMLPNVNTPEQAQKYKAEIESEARSMIPDVNIRFGVMIETIKAAECADRLAEEVDFVSFGTNDLSAEILDYDRLGRLNENRFQIEEARGYDPTKYLAPEVRSVLTQTIAKIRGANPGVKISICGAQVSNHMGAAEAIKFAQEAAIDSISVTARNETITAAKLLIHEYAKGQSEEVGSGISGGFADKHARRDPLMPDGTGFSRGEE